MLARVLIELHRVQPLILIVGGVLAALGFKAIMPSDQIEALARSDTAIVVRVAALEKASTDMQRTLKILADAKCVELTDEQLTIAQIDCSQVFDRVRRAKRPGR